jgi:SAM-dependent methyltransferase
MSSNYTGPKRFLADAASCADRFIAAARDYPARLPEGTASLYRKPYTVDDPFNAYFYDDMYSVLGVIQAMAMRRGSRVLEVGCGPGAITEMLIGLGYRVDCLDPAPAMLEIARSRTARFIRDHRIEPAPEIGFHCLTLEESVSEALPAGQFDGILFRAALHHVVDERAGLQQCLRLLRPGGVIGISEGAWIPGMRELEAKLEEEMRLYGTLENPFTQGYLLHLLAELGFTDIERYHGVFNLVPASQGHVPVQDAAACPADRHNIITARRPHGRRTTADLAARTGAEITIHLARFDPAIRRMRISFTIRNTGETVWLAAPGAIGQVRLVLGQHSPVQAGFRETGVRHPLPKDVWPSETWSQTLDFNLPEGDDGAPWGLHLVAEQCFWFCQRGSSGVLVEPASWGPSAV